MHPLVQIVRPSVVALSVISFLVGIIIIGSSGQGIVLVPAFLAVALITASGNVVNDIFDVAIDKVNAPHRPLPSGRLSSQAAIAYFAILSVLGIFAAFLVSFPLLVLASFNWIVLVAYAAYLKKAPLVGNIADSWLAASTFIAAPLVVYFHVPLSIILLSAIAFFGNLSREIVKDIEDVKGDSAAGAKTLPIVAGIRASKAVASLSAIAAIALLSMPFYLSVLSPYYLVGAVPAAALMLFSLAKLGKASQERLSVTKAKKLMKVAMFLVLAGFLIGALTMPQFVAAVRMP